MEKNPCSATRVVRFERLWLMLEVLERILRQPVEVSSASYTLNLPLYTEVEALHEEDGC